MKTVKILLTDSELEGVCGGVEIDLIRIPAVAFTHMPLRVAEMLRGDRSDDDTRV